MKIEKKNNTFLYVLVVLAITVVLFKFNLLNFSIINRLSEFNSNINEINASNIQQIDYDSTVQKVNNSSYIEIVEIRSYDCIAGQMKVEMKDSAGTIHYSEQGC